MKKTYEKPGLLVENFALSQSIAKTCDFNRHTGTLGTPTLHDRGPCGWDLGAAIIWTVNDACNDFADKDEVVNGGCYNNPSAGMTLFSS